MDLALILYILLTILCFYSFILFSYEWIRLKGASGVFKNLTILWFSLGCQYGITAVSRYLRICNKIDDLNWLIDNSLFWPLRLVLPLIIISIFVSIMSWRTFVKKGKINPNV